MPAVQTTYPTIHPVAYVGMVANSEPRDVITLVCTVGAIAFGLPVMQGAGDNTCKPPAAASIYRGISIIDPTLAGATPDSYLVGDNVAVMTRGVVWVTASVAVAVGDAVYFVPATGVWTNVVGANQLVSNAIWDSSTTGAGLAQIRLKA
jgi:hypothetical protein